MRLWLEVVWFEVGLLVCEVRLYCSRAHNLLKGRGSAVEVEGSHECEEKVLLLFCLAKTLDVLIYLTMSLLEHSV